MSKRLLILIGGHLSLGPRPQKEAAAAVKAGFEVFVRGNWWNAQLAEEDLAIAHSLGVNFEPMVDFRKSSFSTRATKIKHRLENKLASCFGRVSANSFGLGGPQMISEAIHLDPDLVMVHSEAGLWAGRQLMDAGYQVGVDFEDWFSHDLPEAARKSWRIGALRTLEAHFIDHASPKFATTECMAEALQTLGSNACAPVAIPNAFPWARRPNAVTRARNSEKVRFYWFSQTIGPHRGLDDLAAALDGVHGAWELHLLGNLRGYKSWFDETFDKFGDRVAIHPPVSNVDLPTRTAEFDVGLALEIPYCLNKELTASNKIFEYLRCGLPVIATNTRGQTEVLSRCSDAGWLVPSNRVSDLRTTIQRIVTSPEILADAQIAALNAAEHVWAWELFEPLLVAGLLNGISATK